MKEISTPEQQPSIEQTKSPADLRAEAETRQRLADELEKMRLPTEPTLLNHSDLAQEHTDRLFVKKIEAPEELSERKADIQQNILPDAEEAKTKFLKENQLVQYISPRKLQETIPETTHALSPREMREQYGFGWNPGIVGFNDGRASYVDVTKDNADIKATVFHEHFHQLSANDKLKLFGEPERRRGLSINGADTGLNEALTELYTMDLMQQSQPEYAGDGSYYQDAAGSLKMFYALGDNKARFDEAYFTNNPELLREHFDSVCGEGFYDDLSRQFDSAIDSDLSFSAHKRVMDNIVDLFTEYEDYLKMRGEMFENP